MFGWFSEEAREKRRRKREERLRALRGERTPVVSEGADFEPVELDTSAMVAAMGGQIYYETVVVPTLTDGESSAVAVPLPVYEAPAVSHTLPDTTTSPATVTDTTPSYDYSPPPPPPSPPASYDYSPPPSYSSYDSSPPSYSSYDSGSYSSPPSSFD